MIHCQLITSEELRDRQSHGRKHGDTNAFLEPGMMWFQPWLWDHQDPDLEQYLDDAAYYDRVTRRRTLSPGYLRTWARVRDPIEVVLPMPGGVYLFCVDCAPANSQGWRVTGDAPTITVEQGIIIHDQVTAYIRDGIITAHAVRA